MAVYQREGDFARASGSYCRNILYQIFYILHLGRKIGGVIVLDLVVRLVPWRCL
jgi:hypothetical protein